MVVTIPSGATASTTAHTPKHRKPTTMLPSSTSLSGTLSCGALEELWEEGGGSHAEAFMAAEIAMAESSGEQFATGAAGERGYWQINPDHGSLSTYDPLGNAEAAVAISANGTNWTPWTTFTSGAYLALLTACHLRFYRHRRHRGGSGAPARICFLYPGCQ